VSSVALIEVRLFFSSVVSFCLYNKSKQQKRRSSDLGVKSQIIYNILKHFEYFMSYLFHPKCVKHCIGKRGGSNLFCCCLFAYSTKNNIRISSRDMYGVKNKIIYNMIGGKIIYVFYFYSWVDHSSREKCLALRE